MPIDTSSYYPEVPGDDPDGGEGLNRPSRGLFGDEKPAAPAAEPPVAAMVSGVEEKQEPGGDSPRRKRGDKDFAAGAWERFADAAATFLSWGLVPILMPVYGIIMIFGLSVLELTTMSTRVVFTTIVFCINVIIPLLGFFVLRKMGIVDDIGLNERKERLIPYVITITCMAGTAIFMWHKGAPEWVAMFFAGGATAALVNLLVNFRWKISAHAAGVAGIAALLVHILKDGYPEPAVFTWFIISVVLSGLLGSARIWLGRHTVWQVVAGYAVGFCSVFFLMMV